MPPKVGSGRSRISSPARAGSGVLEEFVGEIKAQTSEVVGGDGVLELGGREAPQPFPRLRRRFEVVVHGASAEGQ